MMQGIDYNGTYCDTLPTLRFLWRDSTPVMTLMLLYVEIMRTESLPSGLVKEFQLSAH